MKHKLFTQKSSIEEKKKILLEEIEQHLELDCSLTHDGIKALRLITGKEKELNDLLDMVDNTMDDNQLTTERTKMLLALVVIYKTYPKIVDDYSQESIIVLARSCCLDEFCYYTILRKNVSRYEDRFLKKIYERRDNIRHINNDLIVMDMIYDKFLKESEISKENKNDRLINIYDAMSSKQLMNIYHNNQIIQGKGK